jgi:hypothetical protein
MAQRGVLSQNSEAQDRFGETECRAGADTGPVLNGMYACLARDRLFSGRNRSRMGLGRTMDNPNLAAEIGRDPAGVHA